MRDHELAEKLLKDHFTATAALTLLMLKEVYSSIVVTRNDVHRQWHLSSTRRRNRCIDRNPAAQFVTVDRNQINGCYSRRSSRVGQKGNLHEAYSDQSQ
jgi:hypothetical protein